MNLLRIRITELAPSKWNARLPCASAKNSRSLPSTRAAVSSPWLALVVHALHPQGPHPELSTGGRLPGKRLY